MSRPDGVWQRGWASDGERLAVWQHYTGAPWAWALTLSEAGTLDGAWKVVVRPINVPAGANPPITANDIPHELDAWVMEPQLGEAG